MSTPPRSFVSQAEPSSPRSNADPQPLQRRTIFALALTIFLDFVGFGMILPVMPYFAESLGASATAVTWLSTAFSLAQFIVAPLLGRISDRLGRRPVILFSIAGSVVTSIMVGFAESLWLLIVARVLSGATKANFSAAQAAIADVVEPSGRARYLGILGAALGMGFVVGPGLGGLLSTEEFQTLPFFVAAGLSAINWLFVYAWLPETRQARPASQVTPHQIRRRLGQVLPGRDAAYRLALLTSLGFFFAFALMESTFALYNKRIFGWGAPQTGAFLVYIGLILAVVQGSLVGRMVRRWGEATVLAGGVLITGGGMALSGLTQDVDTLLGIDLGDAQNGANALGIVFFLGAGFAMAAGNAMCMATNSALISIMSPAEHQGGNLGVRESAAALGRIGGPALAGPLFDLWSPAAPLWVAAGVCLLNFGLAVRLRRWVAGFLQE